jgi:hypothetical protein
MMADTLFHRFIVYVVASLVLSCDGGHTATVRHSFGHHHAGDSGTNRGGFVPPVTNRLAVLFIPPVANPLAQTWRVLLVLAPILMGILWFITAKTLVKPARAHQVGHQSINLIARPFFLAVFAERQRVTKNLHAAKKLFQRDDQARPVHVGHIRYTLAINGSSCWLSR